MNKIFALTLRQLKLVEVLSEVQSVQTAASVLGITQSSATKSLQKIEMLFDAELFYRTNKGLLPTRAGMIVMAHAETILQALERAQRDVENLTLGREGELRIGAPNGASRAALQKAIIKHASNNPNISINVKEGASIDLHTLLLGRELDCVVGRRSSSFDMPGIEFLHLYTEIFCVCVRPEHPLAQQPKITLSDLSEASWILPPTEMRARRAIDASFTDANSKPPSRFVETIGLQGKQLLLETDMIGIWPFQAIRPEYLSGSIHILNIALPRTITQIGLSRTYAEIRPKFFDDFCTLVITSGADIEQNQTEWRTIFSL